MSWVTKAVLDVQGSGNYRNDPCLVEKGDGTVYLVSSHPNKGIFVTHLSAEGDVLSDNLVLSLTEVFNPSATMHQGKLHIIFGCKSIPNNSINGYYGTYLGIYDNVFTYNEYSTIVGHGHGCFDQSAILSYNDDLYVCLVDRRSSSIIRLYKNNVQIFFHNSVGHQHPKLAVVNNKVHLGWRDGIGSGNFLMWTDTTGIGSITSIQNPDTNSKWDMAGGNQVIAASSRYSLVFNGEITNNSEFDTAGLAVTSVNDVPVVAFKSRSSDKIWYKPLGGSLELVSYDYNPSATEGQCDIIHTRNGIIIAATQGNRDDGEWRLRVYYKPEPRKGYKMIYSASQINFIEPIRVVSNLLLSNGQEHQVDLSFLPDNARVALFYAQAVNVSPMGGGYVKAYPTDTAEPISPVLNYWKNQVSGTSTFFVPINNNKVTFKNYVGSIKLFVEVTAWLV